VTICLAKLLQLVDSALPCDLWVHLPLSAEDKAAKEGLVDDES
jgi:hypothetical protein